MNDEQINEVMRLADEIADYAWKQGVSDGAYSQADHDRKSCDASRAALEAYLRTIGQPENAFPLNPNGASKWAHLQKHDGAEAIGVVFRTGSGSVGSLVDGRVVWADWLAHPNGSKPESVNAELLEALKAAKAALKKVVEDCGGCEHEAGVCVCPELAAISKSGEAIAAAEAQQAGPENTRGNATAWLQWALHIIRERCPDVVGSHQFDWAGKALEDGFKAGPVRLTLNDVKDILAELNDMPCHVTEADLIVHVERFVLRANGLLPEDQAGNRGGES